MLKRILFSNIPVVYFAGAVVGALVGFFILMATLNAWNLYRAFTQSKAGASGQYVTINKKVGLLNAVNADLSAFSEKEIDSLRNAPFVADLAPYVRSEFGVKASRESSSRMPYMRTQMFFEAVPERFLDTKPDKWHWKQGQKHIPVIIPKEYLNLYNFGFARAQGLPNVSEGLIGQFTFDLTLYAGSHVERYKGSVAGFSNRIQSLLVPIGFLRKANARFGQQDQQQPDRLIIKLKPNTEKQMYNYLIQNGYETTHDAFQGGRVALFVHTSGAVLLVIAGLIILLALIVYALTLQLTVQRNKDEIYQLLLLGYRPGRIFNYYFVVQLVLALVILCITGYIVHLMAQYALDFLATRYISIPNFSSMRAFGYAAMVMIGFIGITGLNTRQLIRKLARRGTL